MLLVSIGDLPLARLRHTRAHVDPALCRTPMTTDRARSAYRAERSHLSELLLRHNGDIKAVCAALDLSRASLDQLAALQPK